MNTDEIKIQQHYVADCTTQDESKLYNSLKNDNLKRQLPKSSILLCELKDQYQMYITDINGDVKPVEYSVTNKLQDIKKEITTAQNTLEMQLAYTYTYMLNTLDEVVKTSEETIKNKIEGAVNDRISQINEIQSNIEANATGISINAANIEANAENINNLTSRVDTHKTSIDELNTKTNNIINAINTRTYKLFADTSFIYRKEITHVNPEDETDVTTETYIYPEQINLSVLYNPNSGSSPVFNDVYLTYNNLTELNSTRSETLSVYINGVENESGFIINVNSFVDVNSFESFDKFTIELKTTASGALYDKIVIDKVDVSQDLIGYATKEYVDETFQEKGDYALAEELVNKANISDVYTKTETNDIFVTKEFIDAQGYITEQVSLGGLEADISAIQENIESLDIALANSTSYFNEKFENLDLNIYTKDDLYTKSEIGEIYVDKDHAINSVSLQMDNSTYVISIKGTYANGQSFTSSQSIDLPLESVVVNGQYNNETKKVILTLKNGSTIDFSIVDLITGLQNQINEENKISADFIEDGLVNKVVTQEEKNNWNSHTTEDTDQKTKTISNAADGGFMIHGANYVQNLNQTAPTENAVYSELVKIGWLVNRGTDTNNNEYHFRSGQINVNSGIDPNISSTINYNNVRVENKNTNDKVYIGTNYLTITKGANAEEQSSLSVNQLYYQKNPSTYYSMPLENLLTHTYPLKIVSTQSYDAKLTDVLIIINRDGDTTIYLPLPETCPGKYYIIKHRDDGDTNITTKGSGKKIVDDTNNSTEETRQIGKNITMFFSDGTYWLSFEEND